MPTAPARRSRPGCCSRPRRRRSSTGNEHDGRGRRRRAAEARPTPHYFRRAARRRRGAASPSPTAAPRRRGARCRSPAWSRPICRRRAAAIAVSRGVFRPDGTPADLTKVRQTDLFVVVLKGVAQERRAAGAGAGRRSAAGRVRDPERERAERPTAPAAMPGSRTSASPAYTEARDDRYIAALDLPDGTGELHARLCRARGDAGRVQIPGARRRGHVRPGDLRPHRDGQARRCRRE